MYNNDTDNNDIETNRKIAEEKIPVVREAVETAIGEPVKDSYVEITDEGVRFVFPVQQGALHGMKTLLYTVKDELDVPEGAVTIGKTTVGGMLENDPAAEIVVGEDYVELISEEIEIGSEYEDDYDLTAREGERAAIKRLRVGSQMLRVDIEYDDKEKLKESDYSEAGYEFDRTSKEWKIDATSAAVEEVVETLEGEGLDVLLSDEARHILDKGNPYLDSEDDEETTDRGSEASRGEQSDNQLDDGGDDA